MTWTVSNILISRLSNLQVLNTSLSHRDLSISVCIDTWSSDFLSGSGSTLNNIFASSILEYLQGKLQGLECLQDKQQGLECLQDKLQGLECLQDKLQGTVYNKNLLT